MDAETILCPSARCEEGALLVGIVMADGRVAFAADRLVVNQEFVQIARAGRAPEKRFRFSSPCLKAGCGQWTGDRCGVIDSVLAATDARAEPQELPECSIRPQCRWFRQSGADACAACPEVITDMRVDAAGQDAEACAAAG
jgi:hypothetical protein